MAHHLALGTGGAFFFAYLMFFHRESFPKIFANFWILFLIALIGIAFFPASIFMSVSQTTALNASLYVAATPTIIMLLSAVIYRTTIGPLGWLSIALGLIGTLVLLFRGDLTALSNFSIAWNDKWAVISALAWAAYCLILPKRPAELEGIPFLGAIVIIGVLILLPIALWEGIDAAPLPTNPTVGFSLFYMAIIPSIVAYLAWNAGSKALGPSNAAPYNNLPPFFGGALGILLLGEQLENYHFVGGGLIVLSLFANAKRTTKSQTAL